MTHSLWIGVGFLMFVFRFASSPPPKRWTTTTHWRAILRQQRKNNSPEDVTKALHVLMYQSQESAHAQGILSYFRRQT